jgi:hypothetical protein
VTSVSCLRTIRSKLLDIWWKMALSPERLCPFLKPHQNDDKGWRKRVMGGCDSQKTLYL